MLSKQQYPNYYYIHFIDVTPLLTANEHNTIYYLHEQIELHYFFKVHISMTKSTARIDYFKIYRDPTQRLMLIYPL